MRTHQIAGLAVATALLSALPLLTTPANAATAAGSHWHPVQVHVPAGGSYGQLYTVACRKASSCVAAGTFQSAAKAILPFTATESSGHWATGKALRLPSDAAANGSTAAIASISCPRSACVAVGDYNIADNILQGFIATGHGSSWARATQAAMPADAVSGDAFLTGVSCPSTKSCSAVGGYTTGAGDQAMAVTESAGRWHPVAIRVPANAAADPAAHLGAVSCTGPGNCVAVGAYTTKALDGEAMAVSERHGRWSRATELKLPRNAATQAQAEITSISCVAHGSCVAVGSYSTSKTSVFAPVAATESGGRWQRAVELSALPGNGAHNAASGLAAVSCTKTGCVAVGLYTDKHSGLELMAMTRMGHTWQRGVQVGLPPHAITGPGISVGLSGVACTGRLSCTAVGAYTITSPVLNAMAATN